MYGGRGRGGSSPRGRGRGGSSSRREVNRSHPYHSPGTRTGSSTPKHHPFDLWQHEETFPQAAAPPDDAGMAKALTGRHAMLTLDSALQNRLLEHFTNVTSIIDNMIALQSSDDAPFVDKVHSVGSHRMNTAIRGDMTYQVVVSFKSWPTEDDLVTLCNRIKNELEKLHARNSSSYVEVMTAVDKSSFTLTVGQAAVQCIACYQPESWRVKACPGQVPLKNIEAAWKEVECSRWCDEHITHPSTRMVIRLLADLHQRIQGFTHLTRWTSALLAYKAAVLPGRREALPLAQAFRRLLQLLSAGLFLADNDGVADPCESLAGSIHKSMKCEQQEELCCAAQTLLRLLSHGAHREILALAQDVSVDFQSTMNCGGIIVDPSVCVFGTQPEKSEPSV